MKFMRPCVRIAQVDRMEGNAPRAPKRRRFDLNAAVLGETPSILPQSVHPLKYAQAREQELKAFLDATAFQGGARRTFQLIPRHLRRRAMSHNVHRIPRRLRDAAQKEMDKCNTQASDDKDTKKRNRKHKRRPSYLLRDYVRRQREYQWLETHIWHAKRMKMTSLWGYKLAEYPRAKGVRSTFKASEHQCTIHDASYIGVIELVGSHSDISSVLSSMTPPDLPSVSNKMYVDGGRAGDLMLHHSGSYPSGLIAPASFLWKPRSSSDETRQLWLWVHPSAFGEALRALKHSVTSKNVKCEVNSLKDQLQRFELTGAKAHSVLYSVLLTQQQGGQETDSPEQLWKLLSDLRTPASLPCGLVVPLSVSDPRSRFPPLKHKPNKDTEAEAQRTVNSFFANIDITQIAEKATSTLWNKDEREAMKKPEPQATVVNKVAEKVLNPDVTFSKIPVLIIQRQEGLKRGYGSGWDLVLPAGWGTIFWVSLIFAGARPIGQRDKYKIQVEQGLPFFPYDYPDTRAYATQSILTAKQKAIIYFKKPPAKRTNYKKLGIFSPFRPPWEVLLGLQTKEPALTIPASDMNYGDRARRVNPSTSSSSSTPAPIPSSSVSTSSSSSTTTTKSESTKQNPTNKKNATNNNKKTTQNNVDKKVATPKEQVTQETTATDDIVQFSVLRGTKAISLVEGKRDSKRLERHKQQNMGMVWIPKVQQPMEDTSSNPHLVRVSVKMARKGVPFFNALVDNICEPTEEDYLRYKLQGLSTTTSAPTVRKSPSSKNNNNKNNNNNNNNNKNNNNNNNNKTQTQKDDKSKSSNATQKKTKKQVKEEKKKHKETELHELLNGKEHWDEIQPNTPHRKIIGYVTSGAYSHVRTSGTGTGFCTAQSAPSIFNNPKRTGGLVLLRNIDSRFYYTAYITIKE